MKSALVKVHDDSLRSLGNQNSVILLLLDPSTASDIVDYNWYPAVAFETKTWNQWRILLLTGSGLIFPTGLTLSLFWVVDLLSDLSWPVYHKGVYWSLYYPQRTYTSPLGDVISLHDLSYHLYEDDTQLYVTFKTTCPDWTWRDHP